MRTWTVCWMVKYHYENSRYHAPLETTWRWAQQHSTILPVTFVRCAQGFVPLTLTQRSLASPSEITAAVYEVVSYQGVANPAWIC